MQPVPLEDALDDLIIRVRRRADACRAGGCATPGSLGILRLADVAVAATAPLARTDSAVDDRRERLLDAIAVLREHVA